MLFTFFSGSKEEREVAELHAVSESNSNTSEYIHQFCCSWSGLFRWRQHCWARNRRTAEHRQTLQLAATDRLHATQRPPSLYILKLSAWWWLHDFGSNGTCRWPWTWRGSQPVSTCGKTFMLILWKGCTISWIHGRLMLDCFRFWCLTDSLITVSCTC